MVIGGYFELELAIYDEFHSDSIKLNSGRNALEYILRANKYNKIYLPYFTCDVLLEPIMKINIEYEFYSINDNLEPIFDYEVLKKDEAFLYTNYFGIKDNIIIALSRKIKNLIVDNSQSFFSMPISNIDTFYSPRKFFGVPDGSYLYCSKKFDSKLEEDLESINRMSHLLTRTAFEPELGYQQFVSNDASLVNEPIKKMSKITSKILASIDYKKIAKRRLLNFNYLHERLENKNLLRINKLEEQIPMVYPFRTNDSTLRDRLLKNKIYTATYWPNVKNWCKPDSLEFKLTDEVIYLPIDQRYNTHDLRIIFDYV